MPLTFMNSRISREPKTGTLVPHRGTGVGALHLWVAAHIRVGLAVVPQNIDLASDDARRLKILLVEDEVLIRMDVAYSLRAEGWHVVETGTAADALDIIARSSFDVLLTDVHMPGSLSGLDLVKRVKLSHPHVKIAIMSGGHLPSDDLPVNEAAFYCKPVFDIVAKIKKLIGTEDI